MTKIFDCEIRNTVQRLEVIQKINEWFPHLLEGTEFLTKAVQETRNHLQQNIAELDAEKAKPEQTTITWMRTKNFKGRGIWLLQPLRYSLRQRKKLKRG
ncbi:MAG: hypothetical protein C4522_22055 [Desulfobacteraceae bacterium]|nr:MAG: hypothetical protein C4522_22055 [Desulfobacteraceae bacterium]